MFAIEINDENMSKIADLEILTETRLNAIGGVYGTARTTFYFVRGYTELNHLFRDWGVLPAYVLERSFEYDPIKIKTNWDQIVRK